eukprot:scaffold22743_cov28-Tisochrysis_lutea.AAC.4
MGRCGKSERASAATSAWGTAHRPSGLARRGAEGGCSEHAVGLCVLAESRWCDACGEAGRRREGLGGRTKSRGWGAGGRERGRERRRTGGGGRAGESGGGPHPDDANPRLGAVELAKLDAIAGHADIRGACRPSAHPHGWRDEQ